jgi:hypothetical protein
MFSKALTAAALGLVSLACVGGTAEAATNAQTLAVSVSPLRGLSAREFRPGSLTFSATTRNAQDPAKQPAIPSHVTVDFDNDIRVTNRGLPVCDPLGLRGASTEGAIAQCGAALVGTGTAVVQNPTGLKQTASLSVFNAAPINGVPSVIIHGFAPAIGVTVPFPATLGHASGDFGTELSLNAPQLPAHIGLTDFSVTIHRTFKSHGKKTSFIGVRCADKNHILNFQGTWDYQMPGEVSAPSNTLQASQKCAAKATKGK